MKVLSIQDMSKMMLKHAKTQFGKNDKITSSSTTTAMIATTTIITAASLHIASHRIIAKSNIFTRTHPNISTFF